MFVQGGHGPTRQFCLFEHPATLTEVAQIPEVDHGEVFTRRWVVDLILDLVGYTPDRDLATQVLVEPSCGTGAFVVPIVQRLIESSRAHGRDLRSLGPAIRGFDLLEANAERARKEAAFELTAAGPTSTSGSSSVASVCSNPAALSHSSAPTAGCAISMALTYGR
jgi:adenine-specific DNA-methyltransferase